MNRCGVCQDFGKDPPMTCGGTARPPIKHAQIKLYHDAYGEKCLTVPHGEKYALPVEDDNALIIDKCGGGDGGGHRLATQLFTYKVDKDGVGRIFYDHADGSDEAAVRIEDEKLAGSRASGCPDEKPCNMILWWKDKSGEALTWDATGPERNWQIKVGYEKEEFCMAASGHKNGSPVVAEKCEDIPFQEGYAFSKQQWTIEPLPPRLP